MSRLKEFFRARTPRAFAALRRARRQVQIEARIIPNINVFDLIRQTLPAGKSWQTELPIQRPLTHHTSPNVTLSDNVGDDLQARFPADCRGRSVYLDPQLWRRTEFADIARQYPEDASLQIMWDRGTAESHLYWTLVANHLSSLGLAPRLYDVTTFTIHGEPHTAYVFQHVAGRIPTEKEWRIGLDRLRDACRNSHIKVVSRGKFLHTDAITDGNERFLFVNFQNFALHHYGTCLKTLARQAGAATHFGKRRLLEGGSYLYQAIPGVGLPARRDPRRRMVARLRCFPKPR